MQFGFHGTVFCIMLEMDSIKLHLEILLSFTVLSTIIYTISTDLYQLYPSNLINLSAET